MSELKMVSSSFPAEFPFRTSLSKGGFPINEVQRFFSPIMLSTPVKLIAKDSLRNTHIVPLRSILN